MRLSKSLNEDKMVAALVRQINTSLDEALESIRVARSEIRANLDKMDAMQRRGRSNGTQIPSGMTSKKGRTGRGD